MRRIAHNATLDPSKFVRVHRSFIVDRRQLQAVERTRANGYAVRLLCGKRLPVSGSGHERLLGVW